MPRTPGCSNGPWWVTATDARRRVDRSAGRGLAAAGLHRSRQHRAVVRLRLRFHGRPLRVGLGDHRALAVHIAVKLSIIREALAPPVEDVDPALVRERRWFIRGALGVAAGAVLLTVGQTFRPLEPLALLAKRHPAQTPQGVPINRTADAAGIAAVVSEDRWQLSVTGPSGSRTLSYADLLALPQVTADLPITCVEGGSADARWGGVRIRISLGRSVGMMSPSCLWSLQSGRCLPSHDAPDGIRSAPGHVAGADDQRIAAAA